MDGAEEDARLMDRLRDIFDSLEIPSSPPLSILPSNNDVVSCVIPGKLYIGSEDARQAVVINTYGIKHVISAQQKQERTLYHPEIARLPKGVTELAFNLVDHPLAILEPEMIRACIESIDDAPGPCLVHCAAGISRSASLVIAYLMYRYGLRAVEARERLVAVRPRISPNSGFWDQLQHEIQDLVADLRVERPPPPL